MRPALLGALLCWSVTLGQVLRVIDGDTFEARLDIWPGLTATETIRLLGVDTPERHGATKAAGDAAKTFTEKWLGQYRDTELTVLACRRDAFGRLLGSVTAGSKSLAAALLEAGHATAYVEGRR